MSVTLTFVSVSVNCWTRNGSTILSDNDLGNQDFDYTEISDEDCIIKNLMYVLGFTPYWKYFSHVTSVKKSRASVFSEFFLTKVPNMKTQVNVLHSCQQTHHMQYIQI